MHSACFLNGVEFLEPTEKLFQEDDALSNNPLYRHAEMI